MSYPTNSPIVGNMMAILKEEAKKAGMDLILDGLEHMVVYKKEMKKEHEMAFSAWNLPAAVPALLRVFPLPQRLRRQGQPEAADEQRVLLQRTTRWTS